MAALLFSPSFAPPPFRVPALVNTPLLPLAVRRSRPPLPSLRCSALSQAAAVQADNDEAAKFTAAAKCGNLIPLHRCIFSDHLTPVLAYRCLVKEDDRDAPSFLFESVEQGYLGTNVGRYSFVGAQPAMEIVAKENLVTIMDHEEGVRTEEIVEDPMQIPRRMMDGWSPQLIDELPDAFCGISNAQQWTTTNITLGLVVDYFLWRRKLKERSLSIILKGDNISRYFRNRLRIRSGDPFTNGNRSFK